MKKALSLLAAVAVMAMATSAFAVIKNGKHDMTIAAVGASIGGTTETCAFCHTPHNAGVTRALWNRTNPAGNTFKLYSSFAASGFSKTNYASGAYNLIGGTSSSLMCLSCHDGVTGIAGAVVNVPGDGATKANGLGMPAAGNLGQNLSNDHPINFTYPTADTRFVASPDAAKVKIIGGNVECASCHDVHNYTLVPFLRSTNAGSALCVACHVK